MPRAAWITGLFVAVAIGNAQTFYIAAPNSLHVGVNETIAIAVDEASTKTVHVYIQDYPNRIKNISTAILEVRKDEMKIFKMHIRPQNFPPEFWLNPGESKYVVLIVEIGNFRKEMQIPLSTQSGYVFVQTDKPIYTPQQRVAIRVISLTEDGLPSHETFKLQIKNPSGHVVEENTFQDRKLITSHLYNFATHPDLGEWSVTVHHGYKFAQNTTVRFELEEYVLPTFRVELKTQEVILPQHDMINSTVKAQYIYGKKVEGIVTFRLGIKAEDSADVTFFAIYGAKELNEGSYTLIVNTTIVKSHPSIGWFPKIEGSKLVVEASVTDVHSGIRELATDASAVFTRSPLRISFKRSVPDFKPGVETQFEADVNYVDGRPARNILTLITATAKKLVIKRTETSDEQGKVYISIHPGMTHRTIDITVETIDPRYEGNQAVGNFRQRGFQSPGQGFVGIERRSEVSLKPTDVFERAVYTSYLGDMTDIYYVVVSKGKILLMNKVSLGQYLMHRFAFRVTHEMVPSFRIVVFTHHNDDFVADSLKIDVQNTCSPDAEVKIDPTFPVSEPGTDGKFIIHGARSTLVGLLGVDEATYELSKQDLLSRSKMFATFDQHDLGCGPGGGLTTHSVLRNAGIVIATDKYTPDDIITSCKDHGRRKRAIREKRATINETEFITPDDERVVEELTTIRQDFRETWIFDHIMIGPDGQEEVFISLPHSITTWVIQAVSVSSEHGMCVTEPQRIVSFKNLFLQLNLPYSVVRNEQIEIQATLFNYGSNQLRATVYMRGEEHLCMSGHEKDKSERMLLVLPPNSATTVAFPVIPLKVGSYYFSVVAISLHGNDIVKKRLNVKHGGYTVEKELALVLDPSNRRNMNKKVITADSLSNVVDPEQKLQVSAVTLLLPEDFIPGTESCVITAMGDKLGPKVDMAFRGPQKVLKVSQDCKHLSILCVAPAIYTMWDMKAKGKLTPEKKERGYMFIRHGYQNQLSFRNVDGSYAAQQHTTASTWLTVAVANILCQAKKLVHIDEEVMCSAVRWIKNAQQPDGSIIDNNGLHHKDIMGGVDGAAPMTAFALIALEECKCDIPDLHISKVRAMSFLEGQLGNLSKPLAVAIATYALALSDSELKRDAYNKLTAMGTYNDTLNVLYWRTENPAMDVETTSYALLTELLYDDMDRATSIAKWLNMKRMAPEAFHSVQGTAVAHQALCEYAIRVQMPRINLVSNISSSNDRHFHETISFDEHNAHVQQEVKVSKLGGTLFINTAGDGVAFMSIKLRYNRPSDSEEQCKFSTTVNVTEVKEEVSILYGNGTSTLDGRRIFPVVRLKVEICLRYLDDRDAEMSIVDAGIFPGFEPVIKDLESLQNNPTTLIQRYEKSTRRVVFYLEKVPMEKKYCFSFRVTRNYIVGQQPSAQIKVYEYYNPDESCTLFYRPKSDSAALRTICGNNICQCAEGGCPPRNPFLKVNFTDRQQYIDELVLMTCDNFDYAWKGKLSGEIKTRDGFLFIPFKIENVIKEGIEEREFLGGEIRHLVSREDCETSMLMNNSEYLIMGKSGYEYANENGEILRRYLLDYSTVIHLWTPVKYAKHKNLQRALNVVLRKLTEEGCDT